MSPFEPKELQTKAAAEAAVKQRAGWTQSDPWLILALLVVATAAIYSLEYGLAARTSLRILNLYSLPFLAGLALLPLRQEVVLAVLLLALAGYSSQLDRGMAPNDAGTHLIIKAIAIALCLRACMLKGRLQRSSLQLRLALQSSLKTAAVVHELKQPLAMLLLQCRLLLNAQEQSPARQADAELTAGLNALLDAAEAINTTLQAMAALLRSVNPSRAEPIDLRAVVQASLDRHHSELGRNGVALEAKGLGRAVWIKGDSAQLGILCDNLLRNALEALQCTPPQQRQLAITLQCCRKGIELRIADSGPGLPTLQLEALQLHSSKSDGLGLGLFTAAVIAQQHDGCLQASVSGTLGGAELCFRLPLSAAGGCGARPVAPARGR